MALRGGRTRPGQATAGRPIKNGLGPSASDLVIVSRAFTDLAEFLRLRQESAGRGHVILDRRVGERRRERRTVEQDRRHDDRRDSPADSIEALMRVLGFMIVPSAAARVRSASGRRAKRPARARRAPGRSRPVALRRTGR
jgi:hypothetical protein